MQIISRWWMSSGEADISILKVQFSGYNNHAWWHFKQMAILDSVAYWEFELLMYQLVDLQRLSSVMLVEITAG